MVIDRSKCKLATGAQRAFLGPVSILGIIMLRFIVGASAIGEHVYLASIEP